MSSAFKMPKLPGYSMPPVKQQKYARKQNFHVGSGGICIETAPKPSSPRKNIIPRKPNTVRTIPANRPMTQRVTRKQLSASRGTFPGSNQPDWVKYDRKVLRFFMYFKEGVSESNLEKFRVRKCIMYFYLSDQTVHIAEPKVENSGIPHGIFLNRQRLMKDDETPFGLEDFLIGQELTINSRTFRITDVDGSTRNFYKEFLGIELGAAEATPVDDFTNYQTLKTSPRAVPQKSKVDSLALFLENDRKVLRFYSLWDDSGSLYGEKRKFVIHYFLSDNSLEIREMHVANSGRDAFPMLLARQKNVPKVGGGYLRPTDFKVGEVVSIYSRPMFIYNVDGSTRNWFVQNHGINQGSRITVEEQTEEVKRMEIPPYNGFGSEQDSLNSFYNLVPKKPRINFLKQNKYGNKALRFRAKLLSGKPEDENRRFVVCFNLANDTLSVFEPVKRNSGIVGGKFIERGQYDNESLEKDIYGNRKKIKCTDLFVGATVHVLSRKFKLLSADAFTMEYFEMHPEEFPLSNVDVVQIKLLKHLVESRIPLRKVFREVDEDNSGFISLVEFKDLLHKLEFTTVLNDQELLTLMRRFGDGDEYIFYEELCDAVARAHWSTAALQQDKLDKFELNLLQKLRDNKVHLRKVFRRFDKDKNGVITSDEFHDMLEMFNIIANDEEMIKLIRRFDSDGSGMIDYREFCDKVYDTDFASQLDGRVFNKLKHGKQGNKDMTAEEVAEYNKKLEQQKKDSAELLRTNHLLEQLYVKCHTRRFAMKNKMRRFDPEKTDTLDVDHFFDVVNFFFPLEAADQDLLIKHFFKGEAKVNYIKFIENMMKYMETNAREGGGISQTLSAKGAAREI
eukprot:g1863.t1